MIAFISGLLVSGYAVAALFFLRFWRQSRDPLFIHFAVAFAMLAAQRGLLIFVAGRAAVWFYGFRLLAFALILYAIWDKNRPRANASDRNARL